MYNENFLGGGGREKISYFGHSTEKIYCGGSYSVQHTGKIESEKVIKYFEDHL